MRTTTFGIELEFDYRRSREYDAYGYLTSTAMHVRDSVISLLKEHTGQRSISEYSSPDAWACHDEQDGLEVTTPAINWRGWPKAHKVIDALSKMDGVQVTRSNGLHVHFGLTRVPKTNLLNLVQYWYRHEELIFRLVKRGRRNNSYCHKYCAETGKYVSAYRDIMKLTKKHSVLSDLVDSDYFLSDNASDLFEKYKALNTSNLMRSYGTASGTVEVRLHHGTLDSAEIESWVILMQQVINVGLNETKMPADTLAPTQCNFRKFMDSLGSPECREIVRDRLRRYSR